MATNPFTQMQNQMQINDIRSRMMGVQPESPKRQDGGQVGGPGGYQVGQAGQAQNPFLSSQPFPPTFRQGPQMGHAGAMRHNPIPGQMYGNFPNLPAGQQNPFTSGPQPPGPTATYTGGPGGYQLGPVGQAQNPFSAQPGQGPVYGNPPSQNWGAPIPGQDSPNSGVSASPYGEGGMFGGGGSGRIGGGAMPGSGGLTTLPGNGVGQGPSGLSWPDWATPSWGGVLGGAAGSALGGPFGGLVGSWLGSKAGGGKSWVDRLFGRPERQDH